MPTQCLKTICLCGCILFIPFDVAPRGSVLPLQGEVLLPRAPDLVLVTSFLQGVLESSNRIGNRLRYVAGPSCQTCLP